MRIVELEVRDDQFRVPGVEPRQCGPIARILFLRQRPIER